MKNLFAFILTRLTRTINSLALAGFEFTSSGFLTTALPIELLSQQGLKASFIQFKFKKYFRKN